MPENDGSGTEGTETEGTGGTPPAPTVDPKDAEIEKWKNLARKHEDRAKVNANAVKELDELKRQTMTEQEKAIEAAKAEARSQTVAQFGSRLVDAEIRAAAAGRITDAALTVLLQGLNRSVFLKDDGDVDTDSIKNFIDGIAPKEEEPKAPSFGNAGQGARGGQNQALNGDPLLRDLKKKLGIPG